LITPSLWISRLFDLSVALLSF